MIEFLLLALPAPASPACSPAQTWSRGVNLEIPLQSDSGGGYWGEDTRKADHATIAMNSVGEVLVAFHSSRNLFNTNYPNLKQVEVALLERDAVNDQWVLNQANQAVIGGVDPTPLNAFYFQTDVKCERPDVIAIGEWFFVVWTRIYDRNNDGGLPYGNPSDQTREPATLECAWVRKVNGVMQVYTGGAPAGQ